MTEQLGAEADEDSRDMKDGAEEDARPKGNRGALARFLAISIRAGLCSIPRLSVGRRAQFPFGLGGRALRSNSTEVLE